MIFNKCFVLNIHDYDKSIIWYAQLLSLDYGQFQAIHPGFQIQHLNYLFTSLINTWMA